LTSFPLGDVTAGLVGVNGILAALYRAQKTGQGEIIDLAIYEALLKFMELEIISYDADLQPVVSAQRKPDSAPRGVYQCNDGCWIAISASTQPVAVRFLNLLGGETLVQDPRFLNNELRVANVDALDELVDHWCGALTAAEATRLLSEAGCAVGPVETVASLLQNPQVMARQSIVDVEDADQGTLHMTNVIPRFGHFPPQKPTPGPVAIGAHTVGVLKRDLQLSQADITALQQRGVIG
jgi:crotonobetainyl-CoA:carnitine CoA-transferase CaiB-like acyl-CoA transferase